MLTFLDSYCTYIVHVLTRVMVHFLAWRHVYESNDGVIDAVLRSKWGLITVSRGGQLLRSWDVSSGVLRWESLTGLNSEGGGQVAYPLTSTWRPGSVVATLADTSLGKSHDFKC